MVRHHRNAGRPRWLARRPALRRGAALGELAGLGAGGGEFGDGEGRQLRQHRQTRLAADTDGNQSGDVNLSAAHKVNVIAATDTASTASKTVTGEGEVLPKDVTMWLVWPLYFAGQALIAWGVVRTLGKE